MLGEGGLLSVLSGPWFHGGCGDVGFKNRDGVKVFGWKDAGQFSCANSYNLPGAHAEVKCTVSGSCGPRR